MSKMTKPRLGRGLRSLISVSDSPDDLVAAPSMLALPEDGEGTLDAGSGDINRQAGERVAELELASIRSNPHQPRRDFQESSLNELAASLKTNGLIQPIIVRQTADGYELIAGERRLRAAKLAGLETLPAIIKEVDGLTQAQWALVENIQREDLNPVDRAQAYRVLQEQLGLSHAELASRLGEERSVISNHLRLLDLSPLVRELLRAGKLALGHAKVLCGVADVPRQEELAQEVVGQQLSVRQLEVLIQGGVAEKVVAKVPASPHIRNLEKSISGQLGMRVALNSKKNGSGKLTIHYASLDQFDELLGKLDVRLKEDD